MLLQNPEGKEEEVKERAQTYICLNDAPCISEANISICPIQVKSFLQIPLSILVNLEPTTKDTELKICWVPPFRIKEHGA